jgi:surface carbohydrate biosynthesis protein (TIGR04326 family)
MRIREKDTYNSLLIWDLEGELPESDGLPVLWREGLTSEQSNVVSIPALIETNKDLFREQYLAWVYEFGEKSIQGKQLVEHLKLQPGFSYWWMTLLAEKCNYAKSKQIENAIALMAFDHWAKSHSIKSIVLATNNQPLSECMRLWSKSLGIAFKRQKFAQSQEHFSWARLAYQAVPHTSKAMVWLVQYLIHHLPLRGLGLEEWRQTNGHLTFFSYSDNWVSTEIKKSQFQSHYWAHLPDMLQHEGRKTNWLHIYVKDELSPSPRQVAETILAFNNKERGERCHVTLDTFLSFSVVFQTLIDWCRLLWIGIYLGSKSFVKQSHTLNLWPLFKDDWRRSMFGKEAMESLLNLKLFEASLECLPKQQCGVYLQENQSWEIGLLHAWKEAGHSHLIGTPHSTLRFWDLRYFFDPRTYHKSGSLDLPLPNQVTFNGPVMGHAYKKGGYPVDDLVEVEALRYLHLVDKKSKVSSHTFSKNGSMRVLVLGDYLISNTHRQLYMLEQAVSLIEFNLEIVVKPHPNCPIQPSDYPNIKILITQEPIEKLLTECDVSFTSEVTSAAVDAYCSGIPIVSVLGNTLNLSPLLGHSEVSFATTPEELAAALKSAKKAPHRLSNQHEFFTLDLELPRWRNLLLHQESSYVNLHLYLNNLDFIDIENCIIESEPGIKNSYVGRLNNMGLTVDHDSTISGYDNSYLLIINKLGYVKTLKDILRSLRNNRLARNRFIIFEISSKRNFDYLFQCFFMIILLRRNPLLFYKYKSKDVAINLLPDSPKRVLGCSGFKSVLIILRHLIRNIRCIYSCNSIIIEY